MTDSRCREYAELELRHIQLELEHHRYHHLRHFVDPYYCYRHGIVKRTGRANFEGVMWQGIVSLAARRETDRRAVVKEHVVPLRVIETKLSELVAAGTTTLDDISRVLEELTHFGTITKAEDALLRQAGLGSSMPVEFWQEGHQYCGDILARYKYVGIELEAFVR